MLKDLFFNKTPEYPQDVIDTLRLIRSENVGPKTFFNLIDFFGSPGIALENIGDFSLKGGRARPIKILSKAEAQKELELLDKNKASIISYADPLYSKLLMQINDPPPIITYRGNIRLLDSKSVAIVGARNASVNGRAFAAQISQELSKHNITVVSGLARGIDTAVHKAALDKTIAVVAGGIDYIYPPENAKLYQEIFEQGLVIAELPVGSKPLGQHFPQRNRLISGLSLGTIVVEASLKSGSLITARFALEQNREIFAVPGFPLDPRCQGTNKLIREGAHLLESIDDVLTNLPMSEQIISKSLNDGSDIKSFVNLKGCDYQNITNSMRIKVSTSLSSTPATLESIIEDTELPLQIVCIILLELELAGKVTRHFGNKFTLIY